MTEAEAWMYLNATPDEDLEDAYEMQLFDHKQFFLSKTVLPTLFLKRLEKISMLDTAFVSLGGVFLQNQPIFQPQFVSSNLILETFQAYQTERNKLRLAITQSQSGENLKQLVLYLLELEADYLQNWENTVENDPSIILSKENDAMELLKAIRTYALRGGLRFEDLKNNANNPPEILVNEMKRLSLLLKKYAWRKI